MAQADRQRPPPAAITLTFLGTGTSVGVPMIGCDCPVCTSADPRNRRRRTSLLVEADGFAVVVDTPPDFREQALTFGVRRVDAVLFTHTHADHFFGFDDIRRYNTLQDGVIPAYGSPGTIREVRRVFRYIGTEEPAGLYRPRIAFRAVTRPFALGPLAVEPLEVAHGGVTATGYIFSRAGRRAAYLPDCSALTAPQLDRLHGVDVMILDALRRRPPHVAHLTVAQSLAALARIGAGRSFITHMAHDLEHAATQAGLPPGVHVPHDGLVVVIA